MLMIIPRLWICVKMEGSGTDHTGNVRLETRNNAPLVPSYLSYVWRQYKIRSLILGYIEFEMRLNITEEWKC